jgi:hypothetical protein
MGPFVSNETGGEARRMNVTACYGPDNPALVVFVLLVRVFVCVFVKAVLVFLRDSAAGLQAHVGQKAFCGKVVRCAHAVCVHLD